MFVTLLRFILVATSHTRTRPKTKSRAIATVHALLRPVVMAAVTELLRMTTMVVVDRPPIVATASVVTTTVTAPHLLDAIITIPVGNAIAHLPAVACAVLHRRSMNHHTRRLVVAMAVKNHMLHHRLDVATRIFTVTAGMSGQGPEARRPLVGTVAMRSANAIGRLSSSPASGHWLRCVTTAYDVRNPHRSFLLPYQRQRVVG